MFQILIMSGDNAECALSLKRFNTASAMAPPICGSVPAEFINEDKAAFVTAFHHCFHVGKV